MMSLHNVVVLIQQGIFTVQNHQQRTESLNRRTQNDPLILYNKRRSKGHLQNFQNVKERRTF